MKGGLRWRAGAILALIGIFGFLVVANFVPKEQRVQSGLWPDDGLRLGLDLQGGIHWVVGVDLAAAITHELEFLRDGVRTRRFRLSLADGTVLDVSRDEPDGDWRIDREVIE